jgi:hypothetical protein
MSNLTELEKELADTLSLFAPEEDKIIGAQGDCIFISVPLSAFQKSAAVMAKAQAKLTAAPETAAERDRLREVNAELLAALRPLAFFSGSFRDEEDRDRLHEMFAVARAAISKATGGENG